MSKSAILLVGTILGAIVLTTLTLTVKRDGDQLLCSPVEPLVTQSINLAPPTGQTYKAIDKGWPLGFYRDTSASKACNPPTNPKTSNYVNQVKLDKDLAVWAGVSLLLAFGLLHMRRQQ